MVQPIKSMKQHESQDSTLNEILVPFSFHHWYPVLKKHTIRSKLIELPESFIDYLRQDGIQLPQSTKLYNYDATVDTEAIKDASEDEVEEEPGLEPPSFPYLEKAIIQAIRSLGGSVFPKLNWSSPRDAAFMNLDGTLKCSSYENILILLKSSDFIQFDLLHPCVPYYLVLRKWHNINPSHEVRCWVHNNKVIAMSQKDICHYYPFLVDLESTFIEKALHLQSLALQSVSFLPTSCSFIRLLIIIIVF
ncbi:hypothetical protein HMI55_004734 [Coelomomyces lativittatus]|nr:hypothetical protein HMI55_004734 [Coelomomyces lativittatus]